jgi:hypothetical protein
MFTGDSLLFHMLPVLTMLGIMFANQLAAQRRLEKRSAKEDQGLRTILQMELAELLLVYDENLRRIAEPPSHLLSGRPFLTVSKGNLGRVALLDPATIATLISAIAFNERIESTIGAQARLVGNSVYRLESNAPSLDDIGAMLVLGRAKIRTALASLEGGDPVAAPSAPRGRIEPALVGSIAPAET